MRTFDSSPYFCNSIGFDRMIRLLDDIAVDQASTYPPYNIEKIGKSSFQITIAVAGFNDAELDVQVKDNQLAVTGKIKKSVEGSDKKQYLHRGIAGRNFERRFNLADHVEVAGANLVNGLLHIVLVQNIPESMRARTIPINNNVKAIGEKAA